MSVARSGRTLRMLAAALGAMSLAGCVTSQPGPTASLSGAGPTLAFESIDGPPQAVFDRLVTSLDSQARTGSLAIVSREGPARYRVRGYLSAQVRRGQAVIAWVWDVYDGDQRAMRLAGEEPAGKPARDAWIGASDQVLSRIAQATLSGIAGLADGAPAATAPEPQAPRTGPTLAAAPAASLPGSQMAFAGPVRATSEPLN
ncbi:MAG: hypothetical protein EPO23_06645 [Xanthobacteraceae bacterium]|nr:MAG: hypothetical protein EPO23_06645 [Xanthobacteraceae bacterium]